MTDATGTVAMYPKLERREWIFGTAPDPRDARIAELEAALRETHRLLLDHRFGQGKRIGQAVEFIETELPERDMTITVEELDA